MTPAAAAALDRAARLLDRPPAEVIPGQLTVEGAPQAPTSTAPAEGTIRRRTP